MLDIKPDLKPALLDVAKRARRYLAKPGRWAQGADARNSVGTQCEWNSSHATSRCLQAALTHGARLHLKREYAIGRGDKFEPHDIYNLARTVGYVVSLHPMLKDSAGIGDWNDKQGRTHDEVLTVLDDAIKHLK